MAETRPVPVVRISKIADRYLVFDAEHVSALRRVHGISSMLAGSTPQNPTQNVFLSLPLELLPEEAASLVEKKVAVLVDEAAFHIDALRSSDPRARDAYLASLDETRNLARRHIAEEQQARKAASKAQEAKAREKKNKRKSGGQSAAPSGEDASASLFTPDDAQKTPAPVDRVEAAVAKPMAVTPTTSAGLEAPSGDEGHTVEAPPIGPLQRHLVANGYFITPGLRFGAKYSVYPGDSLRYHAHFLATDYEWDEGIPMLDIVGSGRLGTSVKKSFLMGGAPDAAPGEQGEDRTRAFSLEWAAM
ncbi:tRNA intron endonuclease [Plectosphaerella cucumerina]|uniref:tRNA-splicing endonuclease subunit Sen34 n=1 Tax=Plectosphaerella cucumerina TaxID=40658 RepID=A0A8K0WYE6_9PEZI|nr:tRNA intron endonuclease [Plectosphaerella cucumerina]